MNETESDRRAAAMGSNQTDFSKEVQRKQQREAVVRGAFQRAGGGLGGFAGAQEAQERVNEVAAAQQAKRATEQQPAQTPDAAGNKIRNAFSSKR